VPRSGHSGGAVSISATDLNAELSLECSGNVIANNRIEGHPDGIAIELFRPGTSCRDNVIRSNTIQVARVKVPASWAGVRLTPDADSTVVGIPIALVGSPRAYGDLPVTLDLIGQEPRLEANVIEGNRIIGAEGLGIEIFQASRNRISNNTISGILQRNPYPGTTVNSTDPERAGWRDANGSGIWVSQASEANEISDNTFDMIAAHAIVLEGSDNVVELERASDTVRDLGTRNRVTRRDPQ
jgi:parallel beta-helix repeat protein